MTDHGRISRQVLLPEVGGIAQGEDSVLDFPIGQDVVRLELRSGVTRPNLYSQQVALAALEEPATSVVDLGCGSGAIGIAVAAHSRSRPAVCCVDNDSAAVSLAKANVALNSLEGKVVVLKSDWLSAVPQSSDQELIVSSPPHTPCPQEMFEREFARDRRFAESSFGGRDGLDSIRQIVEAGASRRSVVLLAMGGFLVDAVCELARLFEYQSTIVSRSIAAMSPLATELKQHIETTLAYKFATVGSICVNEVTVVRMSPQGR